jgi:Tfp pilus assembly protein PilW
VIRRRVRAVRAEKDAGLTLIELSISTVLGLLIMTMIITVFIQTTTVTKTAIQSRTSNDIAASAMQEMSNVIRLATNVTVPNSSTPTPAIVSGTASKLVITSLINVTTPSDPTPTQVTFDTTSGSLVESRCVATKSGGVWVFSTCASTSTKNWGGPLIAPTSGQNVPFLYLNASGQTIALVNGSLPASALATVASITVSVKVQVPGQTINNAMYLTSDVNMSNLGLKQVTS